MKKVLILSGSPRKKNSYKIIMLIQDQMRQFSDVAFEYIMLPKLTMKYCRGCMNCMIKGEDHCPIKDDFQMVRNKIICNDGIIFASPVYHHTVSAALKNLLDRMVYYLHRPSFHDKFSLMISTTELSGVNETLNYLSFPVKAMGFNVMAKIGVIFMAFNEPGPYRDAINQKIEKAAARLYYGMHSKKPIVPGLSDVILFHKIRAKMKVHRNYFRRDFEYWQKMGWFNADYFYPTNVNPLYKLIGITSVLLIKAAMRKILGKQVYYKLVTQNFV